MRESENDLQDERYSGGAERSDLGDDLLCLGVLSLRGPQKFLLFRMLRGFQSKCSSTRQVR